MSGDQTAYGPGVPVLRPLVHADLDDLLVVQREGAVMGLGQKDFRFKLEAPFTQWNTDVAPTERERSSWI